jgi:hypothetical protein
MTASGEGEVFVVTNDPLGEEDPLLAILLVCLAKVFSVTVISPRTCFSLLGWHGTFFLGNYPPVRCFAMCYTC